MRGKIGVGARLTALGLGGTAVAAKVAARPLPVVLVHGILDCVENM
jgi:palmitoyl-protein thioesterase